MKPRLVDTPTDTHPALERLERLEVQRHRDHGTARDFELRAARPTTPPEPTPLFELEPEPEHGPAPMPGQLALDPTNRGA